MPNIDCLPCIKCGVMLKRECDDYEVQPRDGIVLSTSGNYGSRVLDEMTGNVICFVLCDDCLVAAGEAGQIVTTKSSLPVRADVPISHDRTMSSIVGWKSVERPYVPWHRGLPMDESDEFLTPDEWEARIDHPHYRWNTPPAAIRWTTAGAKSIEAGVPWREPWPSERFK